MKLYVNITDAELISNREKKILLIGSDPGTRNFGDVLQARATCEHYLSRGIIPIHVYRLYNYGRLRHSKLHHHKITTHLYVTGIHEETMPPSGVVDLTEIREVLGLHVYGGGFLNQFWGEGMLEIITILHRALQIPIIFSGQQIDSAVIPRLREFMQIVKPEIFGVRDEMSLHFMEGLANLSMDDSLEFLQQISCIDKKARDPFAMVHVNASDYVFRGNRDGLKRTIEEYTEFSQHALKTYNISPMYLSAFQESRPEVLDTIKLVAVAPSMFSSSASQVVDVCAEINTPGIIPIHNNNMVFSSSYHVTLWATFRGLPVWFSTNNDYYDQKRSIFSYPKSLKDWLRKPVVQETSRWIEARTEWVAQWNRWIDHASPHHVMLGERTAGVTAPAYVEPDDKSPDRDSGGKNVIQTIINEIDTYHDYLRVHKEYNELLQTVMNLKQQLDKQVQKNTELNQRILELNQRILELNQRILSARNLRRILTRIMQTIKSVI